MAMESDPFQTGELLDPHEFLGHALRVAGVATTTELDARRKVLILEAFHLHMCNGSDATLARLDLAPGQESVLRERECVRLCDVRTLASLLIGYEAHTAADGTEMEAFMME
jgi:hypothetical protein